jgi:FlaA1/EpsC-like NDP-sugar epimerase
MKLAKTMAWKYSKSGSEHAIDTLGIRPGEKIHETLVNEYELQRVREEAEYFAIYPEYRVNGHLTPKPVGTEYTSENTTQLNDLNQIGELLDAAGNHTSYI